MPPAFSVIVPTFNRWPRVAQAVESVLAQEFESLEVVVVDDGSTDGTAQQLATMRDPRVRLVRQTNQGGCAARNAGAAAAAGRWLTFLDDDDDVDPGWLSALVTMLEDPACAVASCGARWVDEAGSVVRAAAPRDLGPVFDHVVAKFDTGTYAVTAEAFAAAGGFVPGLPANAHTELALRLVPLCSARGWVVRSVPDQLVRIRHRPSSGKPRNHPAALYTGTMYVLENHRERLRRSPGMLGDFLAVAAVSAARQGDHRQARRLLASAVRANPRLRHVGRLVVAAVPPLADRIWDRRRFQEAQQQQEHRTER